MSPVPRKWTWQPDNLKSYTPIPSLKTLFSLLARNQLVRGIWSRCTNYSRAQTTVWWQNNIWTFLVPSCCQMTFDIFLVQPQCKPVQGSEAFLQVQLFRSQFFLQPHTANSLRFFGASIKSPRNGLRTSSWKFVNIAQKYNINIYVYPNDSNISRPRIISRTHKFRIIRTPPREI